MEALRCPNFIEKIRQVKECIRKVVWNPKQYWLGYTRKDFLEPYNLEYGTTERRRRPKIGIFGWRKDIWRKIGGWGGGGGVF